MVQYRKQLQKTLYKPNFNVFYDCKYDVNADPYAQWLRRIVICNTSKCNCKLYLV